MNKQQHRRLRDKAAQLLADGRLKEALRLLEQAVEADPSDLTCQLKIGDMHRRLGQPDAAVAA